MRGRWRGHPLARLGGTVARLPRYLKLGRELASDPAISPARKAALGAGILYVALPLDLIPGIVPVLGQLDDLAALLLGLKTALAACPPETARAHLARAGLSPTALDHDLAVVGGVAAWGAKATIKLGFRALDVSRRLLGRGIRRPALPPPASGDRPRARCGRLSARGPA